MKAPRELATVVVIDRIRPFETVVRLEAALRTG
jgi:hypothetical protein